VAANAGQPLNQEGCLMTLQEIVDASKALMIGFKSWFADGANHLENFEIMQLTNTTFLLLRPPPQDVRKLAAQNVQKHQGGHDLGGGGVLTHKLITIVAAQDLLELNLKGG
jgi:hypothetical protein